MAQINTDQLLLFKTDKECGQGHIAEQKTCHVGSGRKASKVEDRKEKVREAFAELENYSTQKLVDLDIEDMAGRMGLSDAQYSRAVDQLIVKQSDLLVEHAYRAYSSEKMAQNLSALTESSFSEILLRPRDALDPGWPIKSLGNALESPERLNLWQRRKVSGWLENDEIEEGLNLPRELFSIADNDKLFRALKKGGKEAVEKIDVNKEHASLLKYKPLIEKLPVYRKQYTEEYEAAWEKAKAKHPYKEIKVPGRYRSRTVPDNPENAKKVEKAAEEVSIKWESRWAEEVRKAGLKVARDDSLDEGIEAKILPSLSGSFSQEAVNVAKRLLENQNSDHASGTHYLFMRSDERLEVYAKDGRGIVLAQNQNGRIESRMELQDIERFQAVIEKLKGIEKQQKFEERA